MTRTGTRQTRADDERVLAILDAMDAGEVSASELRAKFNLTNGMVQGMRGRFLRDSLPCACVKPENQDGGMGRGWWRA